MAEILLSEVPVARVLCGSSTLVPDIAANPFRIVTVIPRIPAGKQVQETVAPIEKAGVPRCERLLRHADFERVYKQGRRHFSTAMTVFYLQRPTGSTKESPKQVASGFRVGFTVGRALGGAVQRNRMKRRLREAVRLAKIAKQLDADVVINPKKSILTADFAAVLNEVRRAFVVIEQKLGTASTATENLGQAEAGSRKPN